jgi:hypothetical protein
MGVRELVSDSDKRSFMNACAKTTAIALLMLLSGWFVFGGFPLVGWAAVRREKTTIASKRTKDMIIKMTNAEGRLREKDNSFCVEFEQRAPGEPIDVQNVSVNFTQLVGRIQERPIRAQITQDQIYRHCGQVNLGTLYYNPAIFYAFVSYTDNRGKKRKARLFLSVK